MLFGIAINRFIFSLPRRVASTIKAGIIGVALTVLLHAAMPKVALTFATPEWVVLPPSQSTNTGLDDARCRADSRSQVLLSWNADESIFPEAKKYAMSASPIADGERERALQIVGEALRRYPVPLLQGNLKAVFVVKTLHFRGVSAGGTYGSDRVYIRDNGALNGFTNTWITQTFHSEFSSVLLWRHPGLFNVAAWKACNASNFSYGSDGVDALKNGAASTQSSAAWWRQGFIHQYATASVEEDFNSLVEYLFTNAPDERPALKGSLALQQKAAIVEQFYKKLGMDINAPATNFRPSKQLFVSRQPIH